MSLRRSPELSSFEWQQAVIDKDLATPPVSPVDGDRYIVAASPTGAWAGQANSIAWYYNAAWVFDVPTEGFKTWVKDENKFYTFDGTSWAALDMLTSVYDTDNDGIVDKAENVDDGAGNATTAANVKIAYDRRGSYNAALKAITFELP